MYLFRQIYNHLKCCRLLFLWPRLPCSSSALLSSFALQFSSQEVLLHSPETGGSEAACKSQGAWDSLLFHRVPVFQPSRQDFQLCPLAKSNHERLPPPTSPFCLPCWTIAQRTGLTLKKWFIVESAHNPVMYKLSDNLLIYFWQLFFYEDTAFS